MMSRNSILPEPANYVFSYPFFFLRNLLYLISRMQSTASVLLKKSILKPSGEISKDKINLVAGAITQPFAEMVWVTTGGDMETINRLTDVLVSMNTPADRGKLFKIIKMLYGLMGLPFSEEAEPMDAAPDVLEYFIFSFTADFGEIIKDYIAEAQ